MRNFSYTDLSMMDGAKAFDGMSAGVFVDMWGRTAEFKAEELPEYVANTKRALEATRDSTGEIVGFPIDQMGHEGRLAAGWIVDVSLSDGRSVIEFTPKWNAWGREKIASNELRFFSPSINIEKKVVVGGSLTNWPATRDENENIMLRPVELSAQIQTYEQPPMITLGEMFRDFVGEIKNLLKSGRDVQPDNQPETEREIMSEPIELQSPAVVDLSSPEAVALINIRAEAIANERIALAARKTRIADLSTRLAGGTPAAPRGLPVAKDAMTAFLSKLDGDLLAEAETILTAIADKGIIEFTEGGHSQVITGGAELPAEIKPQLRKWVDAGLSVEEFFTANAVELGSQSDYNLSEFMKEK